ncbi:hypothetical protein PUR61_25290 [Streptomyces sp. BE20]|uniref:hypothetical protein n=1 Tax=Streptomyces sp. BE20 TaxID=3002525 RepID=UPI002E799054|nr:hypothetical protein [Streptomyces sp. BE20]MEE1825472.1 hypothetical protein [Streptomyces sp. BE20]
MSVSRSIRSALTAFALAVVTLFAVQGVAAAAAPGAPSAKTVAVQAPVAGPQIQEGTAALLGTSWCRIGSVVYECSSMPECTPAKDGRTYSDQYGNDWRCGLYNGYWAWSAQQGCIAPAEIATGSAQSGLTPARSAATGRESLLC